MTPAERLISKTARVEYDERIARDILGIPLGRVDWRELLTKSERSGTLALVYHGLKEVNASHLVPPEVWADLRHAYVTNSARNLILVKETGLLLKKLAREGVGVMALKGIALLNTAYPTVALRRMCDVDLLVRPEQAERATRVLLENGFLPHEKGELGEKYASDFVRHGSPRGVADGVSVELHRGLLSERSPLSIEMDIVWKRARTIRIGQSEAMALSVEDEIHYLAAHLLAHHFSPTHQWRNLCDLAAILQRHGNGGIDWDYLLRSSKAYKTAGALHLALGALDDSLKTPEVRTFLSRAKTVVRDMGMLDAIEALSRHLPRHDYDDRDLRPSTITEIVEEPTLAGKLRIALANLNSRKRLIAFHGVEDARASRPRPLQFLRSLSLLAKYSSSSMRMAYLVGKLSRETRREPQKG